MDTILYLRLINRILIKDDPSFITKIFEIANLYGLSVTICNQGIYQEGAYISQIVKDPQKSLSVQNFKSFISELIPYLDVYFGTYAYTVAEFYVKLAINKEGIQLNPVKTEIVFYHNCSEFKVISLDTSINKVKVLSPKFQNRIRLPEN